MEHILWSAAGPLGCQLHAAANWRGMSPKRPPCLSQSCSPRFLPSTSQGFAFRAQRAQAHVRSRVPPAAGSGPRPHGRVVLFYSRCARWLPLKSWAKQCLQVPRVSHRRCLEFDSTKWAHDYMCGHRSSGEEWDRSGGCTNSASRKSKVAMGLQIVTLGTRHVPHATLKCQGRRRRPMQPRRWRSRRLRVYCCSMPAAQSLTTICSTA